MAKEKKESVLARLLKEREASDPPKLGKKAIQAYKDAYEQAKSETAAARLVVAEAEEAESKAAQAMIQAFGNARVQLSDGSVVRPACRGERLFYRSESSGEVI